MKIDNLRNKKILVVGYGKEGEATVTFLKNHVPDCVFDVVDQKDGEDYLDKQNHYDLAIKSPGVPKRLISIPFTTATNIFFAEVKGTVIGVTGSKGKSTTATLIFSILKEAGKKVHLVGNIGNPALKELQKTNTEDDIFVYELSSYQLEDIQYSPHIAVILNLFPEHMNYHGSANIYYKAKLQIVAFQKKEDYFIYNPTYPLLKETAEKLPSHLYSFEDSSLVHENNLPLKGEHNKDNMRAAITVAHLFQINDATIVKALTAFTPLPHRLENIGTYEDIIFYDDAISTTPQSTIAALRTLSPVNTLFLGGEDRGYEFDTLANEITKLSIEHIVLFPHSGEKILTALKKTCRTLPDIFQTDSMEQAVKYAFEKTKKGTICLLSTASPSYSIWKNFEEKGDLFKKFVKTYAKNS